MSELPTFTVHRAELSPGFHIAYVREGEGGYPLVLLHGFPETGRIWYRNIAALAAAGFEVIAPDLRGFGDSDLAPDGFYDPVAYGADIRALVHDVLGHRRVALVGGDIGGTIAPHLALTHAGWVERLCIFNSIAPMLPEAYAKAGIGEEPPMEDRPEMDYFLRQGSDGDGLAAEMDTEWRRIDYIRSFYGHRRWAGVPFSEREIAFHCEPFADAGHFRASYGTYETGFGKRPLSGEMRFFEPVEVPTLLLYGPEDPVVRPQFMERCAIAYPEHAGPFVVPGAGHFLQWERAGMLNNALKYFMADRLC